ncbi:MAG: epoxyqueuosine reductase QueH [Dissulfuribacterales bacterium]
MRLLLHICCGPCLLFPLKRLKDIGVSVTGFFYNPNIHPYMEYERRIEALKEVARLHDFSVIYSEKGYGLRPWLQSVAENMNFGARCLRCYEMRLLETVTKAKDDGFTHFSSTLLYSRYQNHEAIYRIAQDLAQKTGVEFYYEDFREGWQEGQDVTRELGIYRQSYCGCIFSEEERYEKRGLRLQQGLSQSNQYIK